MLLSSVLTAPINGRCRESIWGWEEHMHADPLIRQSLEIWITRFLNGGIHYHDLMAATARMRSWDDWGPEWMRLAAQHESLAEDAWRQGRRITAVQAYQTAARYYHMAYFIYTRDPEIHDRGLRKMLECYDRILEYLEPKVEKVTIPFEETHFVGLFSRPNSPQPPPVVILIPGLDSTKETRPEGRRSFLRRNSSTSTRPQPTRSRCVASTRSSRRRRPLARASARTLPSSTRLRTTRTRVRSSSRR